MSELSATNLVRHFGRGAAPVRAVDGISFDLLANRTLGVVGESGCGKSTLGRLLAGLERPDAGEVRLRGEVIGAPGVDLFRRNRRAIQVIFQDPFASLSPRRTVAQTLAEPMRNFALATGAIDARIGTLLEAVGLPDSARNKLPHEFSGGQRQRICIARALAAEPSVLIADEAVSALDVSVQAQIVNLLGDLQAEFGLSMVFISHDMAVIEQVSHDIAVLYLGQVVEMGPAEQVFGAPAHPYTRALIASTPEPDPRLGPIDVAAQGEIPSPRHPPPGCRYHTRCPMAQAVCKQTVPPLNPMASGVVAACHFAGTPGG